MFDGARVFEGTAPDLDLHCARVNASAKTMFLKPVVTAGELDRTGARGHEELRPGHAALHPADVLGGAAPRDRRCRPIRNRRAGASALYETPMRKPDGFSITLSPFKRPTIECAPVDAKAGCLYPNNARAMFEAKSRGFDNCLVCDMLGNVAELANSNVFMAKDGVVFTPDAERHVPQRHHPPADHQADARGRHDGGRGVLRYRDFENADEIFATGNASKVLPVTRIGERALQPGPLYRKARELYWAFAHA